MAKRMEIRTYGQSFLLAAEVGEDNRSWVQVLRTGKWWDPRYEWFEVDRGLLDEMVANFERSAPVDPVYADYDHGIPFANGSGTAIVAGQVVGLEVRAGVGKDERDEQTFELWAEVEWTDRAAELIRNREYRHTSAYYAPGFKNTRGEQQGPTLLGFAITNDPVIHGMEELALSRGFVAFRVDDNDEGPDDEESTMPGENTFKYLLGKLGLRSTASEDEIAAKVDDLNEQVTTLTRDKEQAEQKATQQEEARKASDKLLSEVRGVFGIKDEDDLVEKCRALSVQIEETSKEAVDGKIEALLTKALSSGAIMPAERDYFKGNLERETKDGTAIEETPTAKALGARSKSPLFEQSAKGATTTTSEKSGDARLEELEQDHWANDPDIKELASEGKVGRARMLAAQRAASDFDNEQRRAEAGASA